VTALRTSIAAVTLCAALVALAAPVASAKPKRWIDVSRFQGAIEWERVGDTRVEFAFVQASRGDGSDCSVVPDRCGADERYAANHEGARAAGLRIGAYHRAFAGGGGRRATKQDALSEANLFADQVGELRSRDLRPALDVETPFDGLGPREPRPWIRTWLKAVRGKLGARPIIYTNASSWQATGDTVRARRPPAVDGELRRRQPRRARRELGRTGVVDLAVHELGEGGRHLRLGGSRPYRDRVAQGQRTLTPSRDLPKS